MKGVALTHAPDRKQAATDGAVPFQAGHSVARAGGLEATHVSQEGKGPLIRADEHDEEGCDHAWFRPSSLGLPALTVLSVGAWPQT